jgi:membrane protein
MVGGANGVVRRRPRAARTTPDFLRDVWRHLQHVGLLRTAASLSFTTLLGLVPLATVALVSVASFPIFHDWVGVLEAFLMKHMLPASAYAVVHEQLTAFIENAAGLTGVSIVFLVATALMATATVEREINLIWGIRRRRPLGRRIVVYALGLTAGPALVGATISALTTLITQSLAAVPLREILWPDGVRPLPLAVATLGLTLLYGIVPARRVPWRWAAAGAFAAALALELAREAFALYLAGVPTYKAVYGALAALPVFLLWIYVCWIIVLAGAAVSAALTEPTRPPDAATWPGEDPPRGATPARRSTAN